MKKYSDYKNSSVPWIGEIPTTWNLSQLRYVIECLDGKRVPVELSLRADSQNAERYHLEPVNNLHIGGGKRCRGYMGIYVLLSPMEL